ncbi:MAG TPA: helix-turn-helix domain-containing protein [Candidatus Paceibacterota bacterium]|nr:helix-turn-helix domain-containing protein [Candidatus Paceibacterota bacterium]
MEIKPLKEILRDEMKAKGFNVQKLSEITNIAPNYIRALLDNDFEKLPAAPYVHGYLESIAKELDIETEPLWQEYQKESGMKRSGPFDKLPINRYAQKPFNKKTLIITIFVLIVLAFALPHIADFFGKPSLEIYWPPSDQYKTMDEVVILKGRIANPQDKILVGEGEVVVASDGIFEKEVRLDPGCKNVFDFTVKRFLGLSTTVKRTICYESSPIIFEPSSTDSPTSTINN